MSGRPLRFSLVAGVAALTAAALAITWSTAAVALRAYLMAKTDEQLAAAASLARQRAALFPPMAEPGAPLRSVVSVTEYLLEFRRADGYTARLVGAAPLPAEPLLDRADPALTGPQTVVSAAGDRYRVRVVGVVNGTVLVGLPLAPVRDTVERLALTAAITSAVVLILLTLLARWLVVRRLRPLDEIARSATVIAAGDLDRRAGAPAPDSPAARTEVGRLAVAVDRMLSTIQTAMAGRAASEERMRTFVADASHELRTPVTSISGYLQLIRAGVVDLHSRPDVLRRLEDESQRMGTLVDDLLYLARLDTDPAPQRAESELTDLINDAVADALAVEPDRPITIDAPPLTVVADAGTLRQVLANLLGNVRAHTPPLTPVTVRAFATASEVRVEVSDSGPGMNADDAVHAFERFWRASRDHSGGAGLGLAIVAAAVGAHGGRVGVDTVAGAGTTVWFTIPIGLSSGSEPVVMPT
ncbi:HAMP domain-containing sensor histidine kinase [Actinoplanes sp. NPDC051861]|uniref:sensor histidine kinase n=1 Tax=Actinoplanes sp. NPDC051861 TaxID=3155170 RepID=UPI00344ACA65